MLDRVLGAAASVSVHAGRPGRELGARVDMVTSAGLRDTWRRRRQEPLLRAYRASVYEALWREAADALGASVRPASGGLLEIRRKERTTWVYQQEVALDPAVTIRASLDKSLVHGLLADAGIPVPDHVLCEVGRLGPAMTFLREHPHGVVVKPAGGTGGGIGTTAGVRTDLELRRAVLLAARKAQRVLVEALVPGDVHRLLFLDGELLDVIRRESPHVVGDGTSSIRDLIALENDRRLQACGRDGVALLTTTLDCVFALAHAGLDLHSVPGRGRRVHVKATTNQTGPDDCQTVRAPVAPGVLQQITAAVAATGLRLAGADLITTDPTLPLERTGGAVIEVNGNPGLHHHYHVADREGATRVCIPVLQRVFEAGPPGGAAAPPLA
jgi:D-alanine-D-alanine ligase-like ATP-grasp enzyme